MATPRLGQNLAQFVDAAGSSALALLDESLDNDDEVEADGRFILIGAAPHTDWLPADLERDPHGFIRTGRDLGCMPAHAPESPPFESNLPGVFALGDVRAGSVKRVASAVGEGSVCISQLHRHLDRQTPALETPP